MNKSNDADKAVKVYFTLCCVVMTLFICAMVSVVVYQKTVQGSRIVLEKHAQQYQVVGVRPPKHFMISLKNTDTGQIFSDVYVSKHCSNWNTFKKGQILTFEEVTYKYEKKPEIKKDVNINYSLCG